ncbi:hypothetical protein WDU94_000403 [Cyamophila willieti]
MKWFESDPYAEPPLLRKKITVTFPSGRPHEKIALNLPYVSRGNVVRFPSGYKAVLTKMKKYSDDIHLMQDMVQDEFKKRINRTNIIEAVRKKLMRRNRAQQYKGNEAKEWGINPEYQAMMQEKFERFLDSKRKGNAKLTKKEREKAAEEYFVNIALKGYEETKQAGMLTEEQDKAFRHNFAGYFKEKEQNDSAKVKQASQRIKEKKVPEDIEKMEKIDIGLFEKALAMNYARQDDRLTTINTIEEVEKRKVAKGYNTKNSADQNASNFSTGREKNPGNSVQQRAYIDEEYWLRNKLGERLRKKEKGEFTAEDERQFNEDLEEYLIKRKMAWLEAKRRTNAINAVMSIQEWERVMEEAIFHEAQQEYGRFKRMGKLNDDLERKFYKAMMNYHKKQLMRIKAEKVSNTTSRDQDQWRGTMEEYLYNKAINEYNAKKREGKMDKAEEIQYLESIQAFRQMKIAREKAIQARKSIAPTLQMVEDDKVDTTPTFPSLKIDKIDDNILGEDYWKAKVKYNKAKKKMRTTTLSADEQVMLDLANKHVDLRLQEFWQETTTEPPWRRGKPPFGYG